MRKPSFTVWSLLTASTLLATIAAPVRAQEKPSAEEGPAKRERGDKPDYPPFDQVSKDFEKVISVADGSQSLYTLYIDRKRNQLLAELPRGWANQKYLIAVTQSAGGAFAGLQGPSHYVYWRQYDNRLALIEPELDTRSTGEQQSKISVDRLFTDTVLLDVPIACMGPNGQPVVDFDDLLIGKAGALIGPGAGNMNAKLARVVKAKAFPENLEIAIEVPVSGGFGPRGGRPEGSAKLATFHYSISSIPENTSYKPREADERIGYFTTVYRDLGQYLEDKKWTRYIDRWQLEKRDPSLKLSPPKEPIVFYIENTVPVRYRRWLRQGIEYWNNAFRKVGLENAIEVQYQDSATGAHMDKDPEDVRYNFIRWLNNDVSTAIGPHRANPLTGQILDADVVLTDGWIRAFWGWYNEQAPELAVEGMSAETLDWLEKYPQWDPRLLLATPSQRERILAARSKRDARRAAGEIVEDAHEDPAFMMNPELESVCQWLDKNNYQCMAAHGLAMHMAFSGMCLEGLGLIDQYSGPNAPKGDTDSLDGIPEWFVGPMLSDLVCHEVGHTLGLRHNFKASSVYTMAQINSKEWKGHKTIAGSVMDYIPPNFNLGAGETQGDFAMIDIGPYDYWAIEYGYTFDDPKKTLTRVAEPELAYLTDEDTGGCDPLARRYDMGADPLEYARNTMRIVEQHRGKLLDKFVKDGQSWSKARKGFERTLSMQTSSLSIMAGWLGGAHVNRDHKGDPQGRPPIQVVDAAKQREALQFVIDNCFSDKAFGLSTEALQHFTVDKWSDDSDGPNGGRGESAWPVHDRIMGIQSSVLSMIMNPSTLRRVYDNEFRTPAKAEALTLPELLQKLSDAIYGELGTQLDGNTFTERSPMISSLRRNLQAEMTDRLIILAGDDSAMPRPIRTLCMMHLRRLDTRLNSLMEKAKAGQVDAYTLAHLEDLNGRVDKALKSVQVYSAQ